MQQSIYKCFINNKYKYCGNLLKDNNITALRLFKELDIAQSRHIVLSFAFTATHFYHTVCHTLLVHDVLQTRRGGHFTKVKGFFRIFLNPNVQDLSSGRCFRRALDHFMAWWQHLSICFWRQLNVGGMFSRDRPPWAKRVRLAVLVLSVLSVGLYRIKKNFSICEKSSSVTKHLQDYSKVGVTSESCDHVL